MNKDKKQGKELLELYRLQRHYTYPTLNGIVPTDKMYFFIADQIEILLKTIGGRAKTSIRKECKERKIACPNFKREGINL